MAAQEGIVIPTRIVNLAKDSEVTSLGIKNVHTMQPCGCVKGYFQSTGNSTPANDYICAITLSNKSTDGLTFTYNSDCPIVPTIGNYVFQAENSIRSWITAVDTTNHTLTVELPALDNGAGLYSKGHYTDFIIPNWKPNMYLWGITVTCVEKDSNNAVKTDACPDFIELSVVDVNDLFLNDDVCMALFGVLAADATPYLIAQGFELNGEYGHWSKYYDESWVLNINGLYTHTPDGAPGNLIAGLGLRLSFFTTELELTKYNVYADYYMTAKDV
jgi:hypothetical protein